MLRPADERLSVPVMGCSIRTERWRYNEWAEGAAGRELYDHQSDPAENVNIAGRPEHAELVEQLSAQLEAGWRKVLPDRD